MTVVFMHFVLSDLRWSTLSSGSAGLATLRWGAQAIVMVLSGAFCSVHTCFCHRLHCLAMDWHTSFSHWTCWVSYLYVMPSHNWYDVTRNCLQSSGLQSYQDYSRSMWNTKSLLLWPCICTMGILNSCTFFRYNHEYYLYQRFICILIIGAIWFWIDI